MQEKVLASAQMDNGQASVRLNSYGDAVFCEECCYVTRIVKVDKSTVYGYYVDAEVYCDNDDDEEQLKAMMTGIAICKLFDGMRKFVGWEEV